MVFFAIQKVDEAGNYHYVDLLHARCTDPEEPDAMQDACFCSSQKFDVQEEI